MRVVSLSETFRPFNQVREKADADGNSRNQHQEQNQKRQEREEHEASAKDVDQAIQSFDGDARNRALGLKAVREGTGPGLRVVLKDGYGAVVRQFTGEEFLRVREAASLDGKGRGRILDQKL